ncbi:MAG: fibronectin type III domain-containing protein [Kouleothrix sp.]|jgi:hypothetical protein|nr:fibronectin type III domain-containing protein [Kouleothrix sp.]
MRIVRLCCVLLLSILSIGLVAGAPRGAETADVTCPPAGCTVYAPVATYDQLPRLIFPGASEQINTLAPTLIWSPVALGSYQIQVSPDPAFTSVDDLIINSTKDMLKTLTVPVGTLVTSNLKANAIYYWRVGLQTSSGYVYATPVAFSTPQASAVTLPGDVTVTDPKNGSTFRRDSVLLKWKPVAGALLYRLRMTDSNGKTLNAGTAYIDGVETTFWVRGLLPGTYTWKIKAYNQFGWGSYTPDLTFTIQ